MENHPTITAALFTEGESLVIAGAINRFGTGQHPAASGKNLRYFTEAYAAACLVQALPHFTDRHQAPARAALAKLNRATL